MKAQTHTFSNGCRLIYEQPVSNLPLTGIYIFVKVGSIYEPVHLRGASHFIEHLCFKGTPTLTTAKKINDIYNRIGALFNAYTEKEYTAYTVKCNDEYVKNSIRVLSDMIFNSLMRHRDYEMEHKVVIEENVRAEDDELETMDNAIASMLYTNTSFEYPVDHISYHRRNTLSYSALKEFYKQFYHPQNMCISIVSSLSFSTIKNYIDDSYFTKSETSTFQPRPFYSVLSSNTDAQIQCIRKREIESTHVSISFRVSNRDRYPLIVLENIIGGTMSSRLFNLLREENGLTYTSNCSSNFYTIGGEMTIYANVNKRFIMKNTGNKLGVLPLLLRLLSQLYNDGITKEELDVVKGNLKGTTVQNMEDCLNMTEYNGEQYFIYQQSNVVSMENEYSQFYSTCTKEDVERMIRTYFTKENMAICLVGDNLPTESQIRKQLSKYGFA